MYAAKIYEVPTVCWGNASSSMMGLGELWLSMRGVEGQRREHLGPPWEHEKGSQTGSPLIIY